MGRAKGQKDTRPRAPRRGSESSRILQRRLAITAAGGGMSVHEERTLTAHALDAFFAEQRLRIERVTNRQVATVHAARREAARRGEQASRREAIIECHVEVRGSCGSDVHIGES